MLRYLLLTALALNCCSGYRILGFFPLPMRSQQHIHRALMRGLAERGHRVVFMTPYKPDFTHPNLDLRLMEFRSALLENVNLTYFISAPVFFANNVMGNAGIRCSEYFFGNPVAQSIIHGDESFDAVLMESYFHQEPASALIHKFNCPAIEVSTLGDSAWLNELAGLPDNPSYQVEIKASTTDKMSFTERLHNVYVTWSAVLVNYYYLWKKQEVMDRYFNYTGWESRPPLNELVTNRSIILVNQDIALAYPYPVAPHVKRIGGVNVLPNKPLPKAIQEFMDGAENGVIYFSLGSNLQTSQVMKSDFGKAFLATFQDIPQRVVMKWEQNEKIDFPPNLLTYKWMPQQDVLSHKNCRMFVTHGGYLSLTEAAYHGIPVLGIPFFGDQRKNLLSIQEKGSGLMLSYENVTKRSVSWAVGELIQNQRYKTEAKKISQIIRGRRQTPLEEAIYWIEHAIKYPNFLTPRSANLSFIQLHMIDIELFILLSIYLFYRLMKFLCLSTHIPKKKNKVD